jgi:hypothetical protein
MPTTTSTTAKPLLPPARFPFLHPPDPLDPLAHLAPAAAGALAAKTRAVPHVTEAKTAHDAADYAGDNEYELAV